MIQKVLRFLEIVCLLSAIFAITTIGLFVKHVDKGADICLSDLDSTIKVTQKVVEDSRVTVDNINHAAIDERFIFEKQTPKILEDTDGLIVASRRTLNGIDASQKTLTMQASTSLAESTKTIAAIRPVLTQAQANLAALQPTEIAFSQLASDPNLKRLPADIDAGVQTTDKSLNDFSQVVDHVTHPFSAITQWFRGLFHKSARHTK